MCPICTSLIVAGVTSAGGLATLVARKLRSGDEAKSETSQPTGDHHGTAETRIPG